ncbi:hypothetical protein AVEN_143779-1 [Araneus ventricosus]|uniref:DUF4817 domain-containing protein n=1 Tax=Araneus ventricosus TaxID=182803 RepID=A0A4Y2AQK1_ARAVE|nr:hypothetical protein AVEN_143779-1 [Araneus ventricosus]
MLLTCGRGRWMGGHVNSDLAERQHLRTGSRGSRMNEYSNVELAEVHLAYGAADCNGRAALRLYQECFSYRRGPHHTIFPRVHRRLRETGCFMRTTMNR